MSEIDKTMKYPPMVILLLVWSCIRLVGSVVYAGFGAWLSGAILLAFAIAVVCRKRSAFRIYLALILAEALVLPVVLVATFFIDYLNEVTFALIKEPILWLAFALNLMFLLLSFHKSVTRCFQESDFRGGGAPSADRANVSQ